jgi:hypothetical protein
MLGEDSDLKEKFQEFELKLEQLKNEIDAASEQQIVADVEQGFSDVGGGGGEQLFKIHWIEIDETSFEECEDVESTEDAQKAFKEAAIERGVGMQSEEVLHGDLMVLLCNSAKEEDEETDEITYTDACYYIGMCINTDNTWHQDENPQGDIKIGDSHTTGSETTIRQFIAWNSCGHTCPEEPEKLVLDEFKEPESGGGDEKVDSIKIVSPFGSTIKAKVHELQSMTFKKNEGDPSPENNEPTPVEYVMFKDGIEYDAGALFKFSNYINEASDGYDVTANVNQVSLSSSSATIEDIKLNSKTYELQKLDITSDSCGSLKREKAKDEDDEEIEPEKIKLVSKSDESGSQHTISSLEIIEGSEEVSLGTLDLQSLLVTEEPFISGANPPDFFVPAIIDANGSDGVVNGIDEKKEIELLNDFKIEIREASVGETCTTVTLTPKLKKQSFTFHSGLLTSVADPGEWQNGTPSSFTFMKCTACDSSYSAAAPSVWTSPGSALIATPQAPGGGDGDPGEFPNCARVFSGVVEIDTTPGDNYYKFFTLSVSRKGSDGHGNFYDTISYSEQWTYESCDPNAGWDDKSAEISFRKVYTPDPTEPADEIWQSARGVYTPFYSKKVKIDCDGTETETDFYSSTIRLQ